MAYLNFARQLMENKRRSALTGRVPTSQYFAFQQGTGPSERLATKRGIAQGNELQRQRNELAAEQKRQEAEQVALLAKLKAENGATLAAQREEAARMYADLYKNAPRMEAPTFEPYQQSEDDWYLSRGYTNFMGNWLPPGVTVGPPQPPIEQPPIKQPPAVPPGASLPPGEKPPELGWYMGIPIPQALPVGMTMEEWRRNIDIEQRNTIGSGTAAQVPFAQAASQYLINNPDVARAGVNPWEHYKQFGKNEGRQWYGAQGE